MTLAGALGAFLLAALAAAVMGFAITRGATCMVAAADEILRKRTATRMLALAEAALWVGAGLSLATLAGLMPRPIDNHAIMGATVMGGLLLGIGASVNRACVFGSVARLGAGEWAYALTPLGFLLGCIAARPWLGMPAAAGSAVNNFTVYPLAFLLPLAVFALWRGVELATAGLDGRLAAHVWSPHLATSVIGVTFVVLILSAGAWTYPEALAQLSRGMSMNSIARVLLFLALLGGAILGGAGKRAGTAPWSGLAAVRCLIGGALMGFGSLLIPGGNDSLILVGLPFLLPYAWLAIATMMLSIWATLLVEDRLTRALAPKATER